MTEKNRKQKKVLKNMDFLHAHKFYNSKPVSSTQLNSADRISHKALQSRNTDSSRWIGDLEGKGDALSESTNLSASDNPESARNTRMVGRQQMTMKQVVEN